MGDLGDVFEVPVQDGGASGLDSEAARKPVPDGDAVEEDPRATSQEATGAPVHSDPRTHLVFVWSKPSITYVSRDMLARPAAEAFKKIEWFVQVERAGEGTRTSFSIDHVEGIRVTGSAPVGGFLGPRDVPTHAFRMLFSLNAVDLNQAAWVRAFMPEGAPVWPFGVFKPEPSPNEVVRVPFGTKPAASGASTYVDLTGDGDFTYIVNASPSVRENAFDALPLISHERWIDKPDESNWSHKSIMGAMVGQVAVASIVEETVARG